MHLAGNTRGPLFCEMSCYMSCGSNETCHGLPPPQSPSYCPAMSLVTSTFSLTPSLPLTEGTDMHFPPVPNKTELSASHCSFCISGSLIKVSLLCPVKNFQNMFKGLQHLIKLSLGIQEFGGGGVGDRKGKTRVGGG